MIEEHISDDRTASRPYAVHLLHLYQHNEINGQWMGHKFQRGTPAHIAQAYSVNFLQQGHYDETSGNWEKNQYHTRTQTTAQVYVIHWFYNKLVWWQKYTISRKQILEVILLQVRPSLYFSSSGANIKKSV